MCIECVFIVRIKISIECASVAHYIKPTRKQKDSRMFFTCFTHYCNLPLTVFNIRIGEAKGRCEALVDTGYGSVNENKPRPGTFGGKLFSPNGVGGIISGSLVAAFLV